MDEGRVSATIFCELIFVWNELLDDGCFKGT